MVGTAYGVLAITNDLATWYTQSTMAAAAKLAGDDIGAAQALANVAQAKASFASDSVGLVLGLLSFPAEKGFGIGAQAVTALESAGQGATNVAIQGSSLANAYLGYVVADNGAQLATDSATIDSSNTEVPTSDAPVGLVNGTVTGPATDGHGTDLNGVDLTDTASSTTFSTGADTNSGYSAMVPTGQYQTMDLGTFNLTTGVYAPASEEDVSNLNSTTPVEIPPIPATDSPPDICDPVCITH